MENQAIGYNIMRHKKNENDIDIVFIDKYGGIYACGDEMPCFFDIHSEEFKSYDVYPIDLTEIFNISKKKYEKSIEQKIDS